MGLLNDIRLFVKKFTSNPIKTTIIVYLIYKILKKQNLNENFYEEKLATFENEDNKNVLIFDDKTGSYIVINGIDVLYSGTDEEEAKKVFEVKNKIQIKSKIENLYEKVIKKEAMEKATYLFNIEQITGIDDSIEMKLTEDEMKRQAEKILKFPSTHMVTVKNINNMKTVFKKTSHPLMNLPSGATLVFSLIAKNPMKATTSQISNIVSPSQYATIKKKSLIVFDKFLGTWQSAVPLISKRNLKFYTF